MIDDEGLLELREQAEQGHHIGCKWVLELLDEIDRLKLESKAARCHLCNELHPHHAARCPER